MRSYDYDAVCSQWLRAIRGPRSQVGFSRRLGYKSNVIYLWENARNWPTASKALWAVERTGVDVPGRIGGFFREPPAWLRTHSPVTREGVARLLGELKGTTSTLELARRTGASRFAVARWLTGEAQPRLPDFFRVVEAASLRLLDFIALFVDPTALPSLAASWAQLEAARRLGYDQPWAQAVFLALQLEAYKELPVHQPGWIAQRLGLSLDLEEECLALLSQAGYLRQLDGGRLEAVRVQTVDTRSDPAASRKAREWWAATSLERMRQSPEQGVFSYNVFNVSRRDFDRIKQLQRNYFRGLRAIVAESEPSELVAVTYLQILALDPCDGEP